MSSPDTARPSLGAFLRRARRAKGLTQAQLAARAFVSSRTIGDIESGVQEKPRPDTLGALELALDLRPATLRDIAVRPADRDVSPMIGRAAELASALRTLRAGQRLVVAGPPGSGVGRFIAELERTMGPAPGRPERRNRRTHAHAVVVLEALTAEQSRELFLLHAGRAGAGTPPAEIDELCENVDRLPAAIVHLGRRLDALGAHPDARSMALGAAHFALARGYDRVRETLPPDAKRALALLGLFERVCDPSALADIGGFRDVGSVVAELRDAFLLGEPSMSAYAIPRTVVAYARTRMTDERPSDAELRFVRWCVRSSARVDADINADTARAVGAVEARLAEYERAISLARANGALDDAMRISASLWYYFWSTSQSGRGLRLLRDAIDAYEREGDGVSDEVAAETYARASSLAHNAGTVSLRVASRWADRAVDLFRAAGRPDRALHAMIPSCSLLFELGDIDGARETAQRALALARDLGEASPVGILYNNLGTIHEEVGEFELALEAYRNAAALFTVSTPTVVRAYTLANIGSVQTKIGQPRDALVVLRSALRSARDADAEAAVILALRELAETSIALGRTGRAAVLAALALSRAQAVDATFDVISAAESLAHAIGDTAPAAAAALYGSVDALRLRTDRPRRPPAAGRRERDLRRIAAAIGAAALEQYRLEGITRGPAHGVALWRTGGAEM